MNQLLQAFNQTNSREIAEKEAIVKRLLEAGHVNANEAIVLLRTINMNIAADKLEMSSGAKIVGGSDFETVNY